MRWIALVSCALVVATATYSLDDPNADHTERAIALDESDRPKKAALSFIAAVRFAPDFYTYTNLGVCYMRLRSYPMAARAMVHALDLANESMDIAKGDEEALGEATENLEWVEESWQALLKSWRSPGKPRSHKRGAKRKDYIRVLKKTIPLEALLRPDQFDHRYYSQQYQTGVANNLNVKPKHYRPELIHQRNVPLAPELPRVSLAELTSGKPEFAHFLARTRPFILTGAMEDWKAMEIGEAMPQHISKIWPESVTDFYPFNMLLGSQETERHSPYLTRLKRASEELVKPDREPTIFGRPRSGSPMNLRGKYMHLQLTPSMWRTLEEVGTIAPNRHFHLEGDEWFEECVRHEEYGEGLMDEYHIKTHWKIILIGTPGAGMFNHSDTLLTSSWHAHISGRKWWMVCGINRGHGPGEGEQHCYESYLMPGEILYYGPHWSHETQNLGNITSTITGTVTHENNFKMVATKLHEFCAHVDEFSFSSDLCDALDRCYVHWHKQFTGKDKPEGKWRPWRELAKPDILAKKVQRKYHENNYDGRNYITENIK